MEDIEMNKRAKELKAKYMREYRKRPEAKVKQRVYEARHWNKKAEQEEREDKQA